MVAGSLFFKKESSSAGTSSAGGVSAAAQARSATAAALQQGSSPSPGGKERRERKERERKEGEGKGKGKEGGKDSKKVGCTVCTSTPEFMFTFYRSLQLQNRAQSKVGLASACILTSLDGCGTFCTH